MFTDWKLCKDSCSGHREAARSEAFWKRERAQPAGFRKRAFRMPEYPDDVIFLPALTPIEAAVLPARERPERKPYGVLHMVPGAWEAGERQARQRTKIWVR